MADENNVATPSELTTKSPALSLINIAILCVLATAMAVVGTLEFQDRINLKIVRSQIDANRAEVARLTKEWVALQENIDSGKSQLIADESLGDSLSSDEDGFTTADQDLEAGLTDSSTQQPKALTGYAALEHKMSVMTEERVLIIRELTNLRRDVDLLNERYVALKSASDAAMNVDQNNAESAKVQSVDSTNDVARRAASGIPPFTGVNTLAGHVDKVVTMSFSPNGEVLATAGFDRKIILWDTGNGSVLHELTGHQGSITDLDFSPDGVLLASASKDRTIKLWHAPSGAQIRTLEGHKDDVLRARFSVGGNYLASLDARKKLNLWDPKEGRRIAELNSDRRDIRDIAFSQQRGLLSTAGASSKIRFLNIHTNREVFAITGLSPAYESIAISASGKLIASGSSDSSLQVWNLNDNQLIIDLNYLSSNINDIDFSPDDRFVLTATDSGVVNLWSTQDGTVVQNFNVDGKIVTACSMSPDGLWLASAGTDNSISLWTRSSPL